MPWRNLRSIFSTLWITVQMLVSTQSSTVKNRLKAKIFVLRRDFSQTLLVSCQRRKKELSRSSKENPDAPSYVPPNTGQLVAVFDRILNSLLIRAKDRRVRKNSREYLYEH